MPSINMQVKIYNFMNVFISIKLKNLRKNKILSQEEVADLLYISQSAYARMENGENY